MGTGQHPFLLPSGPHIIVFQTDSSFCLAICSHASFLLGWFSNLKMEGIRFSETTAHIRTIRRYIPEDGNFHNYRCENLKFYKLCDSLQGNESCDATSHAQALPRCYISCLKWTEVTFRIALVYIVCYNSRHCIVPFSTATNLKYCTLARAQENTHIHTSLFIRHPSFLVKKPDLWQEGLKKFLHRVYKLIIRKVFTRILLQKMHQKRV
jgi:hypothetical protein